MTSRRTTKLALAAASSLVSALTVAWYLSHRAPKPLETRWVELPPPTSGPAPARPSGYRVRALTPEERDAIAPASALQEYDELSFLRNKANARYEYLWPEHPRGRIAGATNSLGLRGAREVREDRPELRILVLGDSHTDGVCDPGETYVAEVERRLAAQGRDVEALNAGAGGSGFHNYVGALERFAPLAADVVVVGVFGGNDFYDALALQHLFAGTSLPVGGAKYRDDLARANDVSPGAVGQALVALRYFTEFPGEVEVALEAARTASAEIVDLCEQGGARPVFLYIPSPLDVARKHHEDVLGSAIEAAGLARADLTLLDAMGERYLADLRAEGCEVVDLRPAYRALAGSPYWERDFHLNLEGHRIAADALAPRIADLCPPGFERRAPEPDVGAVGRAGQAPVIGKAWTLEVEDAPLDLPVLDEARVRALFALPPRTRFDEQAVFVLDRASVPGVDDDGLWVSPAAPAGAKRVLLAADELVYGFGDSGPRLGELASARTSVECLDATTPGAGPLHYLGLAGKHSSRGIDTYVVVWNGGNDFLEALELRRALGKRRDGDDAEPIGALGPVEVVERFAQRGRSARQAVEASVEFLLELRRRIAPTGARLVLVVARPTAGSSLSETGGALGVLDQMANLFTGTLRRAGIECLDPDSTLELERATEPVLDDTGARLTPKARERLADTISAALSSPR